jgi:hypothetical protein
VKGTGEEGRREREEERVRERNIYRQEREFERVRRRMGF